MPCLCAAAIFAVTVISAAGMAQQPVPSAVERPVPSAVERPVPSAVEGPVPDAAPRPVADVPSVRIDAVVTGANGRPILDLRPSDFELLENGSPRPIGAVELRTLQPSDPADVTPIETGQDEARAAGQRGTRVFAFFLDEFHVSAGASSDRVRDALTRFVDEKLRPQDLAIVMKPLDAVTAIRFTRDRARLHGVIAGFAGRKGDYAPRSPFEEQYIGRAPATVSAARRQIVNAGLRELTMRMGELNTDRGVIVLVSEGFPRDNSGSRGRVQDLQGVVRASSRFHLAVYTINPAAPAEDVAPAEERERAVATLQWLAAQTGGRAVEADALTAGLARLAHDLEAYYALTYQPAAADGRFHPVEVRAKRLNVQVRTRPGYWAPLGSEWRAMVRSASTILPMSRRALRRSSIIDAWIGLVPDGNGRARMVLTWEPRTKTASPDVVAVKARTSKGVALFDGRVRRVGSGSGALGDNVRFDVPAGRVELDLTILDIQGRVLDTDARDFDVPDLRSQKRGPVLLAPEVVRARTLRDFNTASADPDAAPSSVRTFARGDRLLIRVPAFDASGASVQVTAKVLNELGQPMRTIDATAGTPRDGITQFALPLAWLVPGAYQIELLGSNANGAVRERLAFRVTG
jgi:VWFA-related protein